MARSVLAGAVVGIGASALHAWALHYPQSQLRHLTLEIWTQTMPSYLLAGLACGLLTVALARMSTQRATSHETLEAYLGTACNLGAWIASSFPLFVWLVYRDGAWLPIPRDQHPAILAGLLFAYVALFIGSRRIADSRGDGPTQARVASTTLLIALALLSPLGVIAVGASDHLRVFARSSVDSPPNVLVIVLDTVRADRLSTYGYERPTSPALDEFAKNAIRFDNFHSTSIWTLPSHSSLFTGLFPISHGATQESKWLDTEFVTLAEVLRNGGYQTWGASANPNVSRRVNLAQGFERFLETWRLPPVEGGGAKAGDLASSHPNNRAFEQFLKSSDPRRPFFAFINYIDAHVPLVPPSPYLEAFLPSGANVEHAVTIGRKRSHEHYIGEAYDDEDLALLSDLYDGEIAYLSASVGRLLDSFRRDERFEDTLIIITSDHGEHFGEKGLLGHMFGLYNVTVRVPLLIRLPDAERGGEEESRKGQLVDLFVTILAAAGLEEGTGGGSGVDLLASKAPRREAILSEYYYPSAAFKIFSPEEYAAASKRLAPFKRRLRAIELYGYRYIWSSNGRHELYNILNDPAESTNLLADGNTSPMADQLQRELDEAFEELLADGVTDPIALPPAGVADAPELDAQTRDALRSLGYMR